MENDIRQSRQAYSTKKLFIWLHQSTITLCNLYDALPAAILVRPDFVNGGYGGGSNDQQSFHYDPNHLTG